jgi:hypothetical protein
VLADEAGEVAGEEGDAHGVDPYPVEGVVGTVECPTEPDAEGMAAPIRGGRWRLGTERRAVAAVSEGAASMVSLMTLYSI